MFIIQNIKKLIVDCRLLIGNNPWVILLAILLLAAVVRLYRLGTVPPSPYLDEVSNGYNAYSLLMTGKDEYGRSFPLLMQAYNDFRPTLLVYMMTPFVKMFGLSVWAIRLPTVILSIMTTGAVYILTREIFNVLEVARVSQVPQVSRAKKIVSKKLARDTRATHDTRGTLLALASAFLFALSPWSIYSSRLSDEINMSLSFFVFGLMFFFLWYNRRSLSNKSTFYFFASIICFVVTFYAYHGVKFFLPFFLVGLVVIYFREIWESRKIGVIGGLVGILLLIPLYLAFQAPGTTVRLGAVNSFFQQPEVISLSAKRLLYDSGQNAVLGKVFDNRRFLLGLEFTRNVLRNFDITWLFIGRENKTFRVVDVGPFYLFALPLTLLGIIILAKEKRISWKVKSLFVVWILASTIPSGMSSESPHLNRTNTMLPAFIIIQALGLVWVIGWIRERKLAAARYGGYGILGGIIGISFLWFLHSYFVTTSYTLSKSYQYGLQQAFLYAKQHEKQYDSIVVSNAGNFIQSYMYYLFANKYDPTKYIQNGGTKSAFFTDDHRIGKYFFTNMGRLIIDTKGEKSGRKIMYITNPSELSEDVKKAQELSVIQKYQFLDGSDSVWVWEGRL